MIYLDNAASTWPKPEGVADAVKKAIVEYGANPGRGGHRLAVQAEQAISGTRHKLAQLLGVRDPGNLLFCLNTTHALNLALKGLLREGDHLILTGWEHNAVARPVEWLKRHRSVQVTIICPDEQAGWAKQVEEQIRANTRLIVTIHGSNVIGEILPIADIGEVARKHGIFYLVDAAQTAGLLPIRLDDLPVDLLAFPGHKGLYGPQGTGGLYASPDVPLVPIIQGGTGNRSEELEHPGERPVGFESGTPNTPGIAGLGAGVEFVLQTGIEKIYHHEMELIRQLWEGLTRIEGVRLVHPKPPVLPILSFNIDGVDGNEAATILDQHYHIAVRAGFHCAALAHRSLKTADRGAVRVSPGYFNTSEEIDQFIQAVREIAEAFRGFSHAW
ncbi:aminotransferase class V-fold PLP-dependent enzyme [Lihuaxuella thermophila]|uniref:cysteine desulfurase n=1 Tax=Lihuaxuella thermophila TaxID=1173111 RepID=A0A1H8BLM1_9BACL|nr:aminotransferase class V-fold PLP-dependent enzyme [Lihuaxuella thermophila]SEM83044.1 cysteine desulfurase family protein [Lihuaxuella thermophila]